MLGSALNEQGGGAGLCFYSLGCGGIPPTPHFRRTLASADGDGKLKSVGFARVKKFDSRVDRIYNRDIFFFGHFLRPFAMT